jgi:hypothetical protein
VKPRTMPSGIGGGDGGGTAAGQGKGKLQRRSRPQRRIRHVTEAANPRIGAAWVPKTPKADRVRPETGARCGKAASRELRGGRLTTAVPTATVRGREFLQCKLASSPPFRSSQIPVLMARIRSKLSVILSLGGGVMMGLLYEQSRITSWHLPVLKRCQCLYWPDGTSRTSESGHAGRNCQCQIHGR